MDNKGKDPKTGKFVNGNKSGGRAKSFRMCISEMFTKEEKIKAIRDAYNLACQGNAAAMHYILPHFIEPATATDAIKGVKTVFDIDSAGENILNEIANGYLTVEDGVALLSAVSKRGELLINAKFVELENKILAMQVNSSNDV